ncbi:MAG: type II secretion system F family protein, partial [Aquificaceae bacterium]
MSIKFNKINKQMVGNIQEFLEKNLSIKPKVSYYDLSFILLELSMLLESGLSLVKALEVVESQVKEKSLKNALKEIRQSIEKGESIYRSFSKVGIFPEFFQEMLKVVQRGENLPYLLRIAGEYLQSTAETRTRILNAIAYPSFVIITSLLAVLVVVKFVIPKILLVLQGLGKELPLITKVLILFANLLSYLLYLVPLLVVFYFLREKILGKERWARYFLRLPVFGSLSLQYNVSRFAGTLHMALSSGIPITKAISLSIGSISNHYLRSSLVGIESEIAKGKSLSTLLRERGVFPETFINLLAIGERSGELERSLKALKEMYERQAQNTIAFWLRFVEPLAMLLV